MSARITVEWIERTRLSGSLDAPEGWIDGKPVGEQPDAVQDALWELLHDRKVEYLIEDCDDEVISVNGSAVSA